MSVRVDELETKVSDIESRTQAGHVVDIEEGAGTVPSEGGKAALAAGVEELEATVRGIARPAAVHMDEDIVDIRDATASSGRCFPQQASCKCRM